MNIEEYETMPGPNSVAGVKVGYDIIDDNLKNNGAVLLL